MSNAQDESGAFARKLDEAITEAMTDWTPVSNEQIDAAADALRARGGTSITFAGEACEGFAERVGGMDDWYVRITPLDGEPFDGVIVGSGQSVTIDGDTWYDAVTYYPADDQGERIEGAAAQTVRVADVYVY